MNNRYVRFVTTGVKLLFLPVLLMLSTSAWSQTFTRINTGAIVKDPGNNQGSAWGDYDNDGFVDLFITHSSGFGTNQPNLLYHNEGNRTFAKVTGGTIANDIIPNAFGGGSWGDYDNDGDLDLFTPAGSFQIVSIDTCDRLYRNDGNGNFTKMTSFKVSTTDGSWVDYNNDGYLDITLGSVGGRNTVFLNNGDGTFTKIDTGVVATDLDFFYTESWSDFDNDGDLDVFWPTAYFDILQKVKNRFFINQGSGYFTSMDTNAAVVSDDGWSAGGSWGDYDNDGNMDLFVPGYNPVSGVNHLYHNNGDGTFTKLAIDSAFSSGAINLGSVWGDFDNDGDLDLFVTSSQIPFSASQIPTFRENLFFRNDGNGIFTRITSGDIVKDGGLTATGCDYDNDGFLDILIVNGSWGAPNVNYLYHNDGNSNHWTNVRCVGTASNRSAIGARLKAKATINGIATWQIREVAEMTGCHSNNDLRVHFGFGNATVIDSLVIRWPSGQLDTYTGVAVDSFYTATEGSNIVATNVTNIFPDHSWLDKIYARKGIDSVRYTARFFNLYHRPFSSHLILTNMDNGQKDSVILYDDGLHGDSLANDGVYGGYIPPQLVEGHFATGVSTTETATGRYFYSSDTSRFTTAGPLKLLPLKFVGDSIPNPGDILSFKCSAKNVGSTFTLRDIKLIFSCPDTCIVFQMSSPTCTIAAGADTTFAYTGRLRVKETTPDGHRFPIVLMAMIDVYGFWKDTVWLTVTSTSGFGDRPGLLPVTYSLEQNYPNPFNPTTAISYQLPAVSHVSLKVFDLLGREVTTLVNELKHAGSYTVNWDASRLASGVYFYTLNAGKFRETKRMIFVK